MIDNIKKSLRKIRWAWLIESAILLCALFLVILAVCNIYNAANYFEIIRNVVVMASGWSLIYYFRGDSDA